MIDYSKGKIYKIITDDGKLTYIGSTTRPLIERFQEHKSDFRNKKFNSSSSIFDKYDMKNIKIELIENYPCNSRLELVSREGYWIRTTKCVNMKNPMSEFKTYREYYEQNFEKERERTRQKRLKYKERYNQKYKEYRENNLELCRERTRNYMRKQAHKKKFKEVLEELIVCFPELY